MEKPNRTFDVHKGGRVTTYTATQPSLDSSQMRAQASTSLRESKAKEPTSPQLHRKATRTTTCAVDPRRGDEITKAGPRNHQAEGERRGNLRTHQTAAPPIGHKQTAATNGP